MCNSAFIDGEHQLAALTESAVIIVQRLPPTASRADYGTEHCSERKCYREKEAERTDCACDEADYHMESNLPSSNFCSSWSCVEVDTERWKERDRSEENWFGRRMDEDERSLVDERLEMVEGEKAELERYVSDICKQSRILLFLSPYVSDR